MKFGRLAAVAATLAVALAGCGGSATNEDETASSTPAERAPNGQPPQFDQGAFTEFQQCLEDNGVTLPSPGDRGGAPPSGQQGGPPAMSEEAQRAFEACGDYLPSRPGQGDFGFSG